MGSQTASLSAAAPSAPAPVGHKRPKHTVRNVSIVVGVALVVVAGLVLVPVQHSFSGTLSSSSTADGIQDFNFPTNAQVSGTWNTGNGAAVTFTIYDSNGNVVYGGNASEGQFAFQANGSSYEFDSSSFTYETTTISGSYMEPIIPTGASLEVVHD